MVTVTENADQTYEFGKKIASKLKGATILALIGELGAGKTTLIQGLAEGLGITQRVISPTFILLRKYDIPKTKKTSINTFYHIDLYRLEGDVENQVLDLGVNEFWNEKTSIVVIEWADKAKSIIPKRAKWIKIEYLNDTTRKISIS